VRLLGELYRLRLRWEIHAAGGQGATPEPWAGRFVYIGGVGRGRTFRKEYEMRNLMWVGVLLVVLGIAGLIVQNVTFTETDTVAEIGPLTLQTEEEHNVPIPTIAGIVAVLAGLGIVVASRRHT